jgi:uncharacterized membrane protein
MGDNAADSHRPIGAVHRKPKLTETHGIADSPLWGPVAIALGAFLTVAGVMHFVAPSFFDAIIPPWLWPSERFWTYTSGVAELIIGPLVLIRRTRRIGALAAVVLLVLVYPANLYMVWDWRDREMSEQFVSWARLPFQFLFLWVAWMVAKRSARVDSGQPN